MNALDYATLKHEGQLRKDKKTPYIEHPKAVAKIAREIAEVEYEKIVKDKGRISMSAFEETFGDLLTFLYHVEVVGLLHDTIEDTDATFEEIQTLFGNKVAWAVQHLTKKEGENYLDRIMDIEKTFVARIVKRADLMHNMSDLNEGSLKDKYRLAKYILEK